MEKDTSISREGHSREKEKETFGRRRKRHSGEGEGHSREKERGIVGKRRET
jgi:hypothetical protein